MPSSALGCAQGDGAVSGAEGSSDQQLGRLASDLAEALAACRVTGQCQELKAALAAAQATAAEQAAQLEASAAQHSEAATRVAQLEASLEAEGAALAQLRAEHSAATKEKLQVSQQAGAVRMCEASWCGRMLSTALAWAKASKGGLSEVAARCVRLSADRGQHWGCVLAGLLSLQQSVPCLPAALDCCACCQPSVQPLHPLVQASGAVLPQGEVQQLRSTQQEASSNSPAATELEALRAQHAALQVRWVRWVMPGLRDPYQRSVCTWSGSPCLCDSCSAACKDDCVGAPTGLVQIRSEGSWSQWYYGACTQLHHGCPAALPAAAA